MKLQLSAVIYRDQGFFVAECPQVGTFSCGDTKEQAMKRLKEMTSLYMNEMKEPLKGEPILTSFSLD